MSTSYLDGGLKSSPPESNPYAPESRVSYSIGVDVGGTFTDLCLWSPGGQLETFKVLSTPEDPSLGVMDGLSLMAESIGLSLSQFASRISRIVHGTTVTTNATLTRQGAVTSLLTTDGVRDALEMRRGIREEQYNNRYTNVRPLVPRRRRIPVRERMGPQGQPLLPLDPEEIRAAVRLLRETGTEALAICFLNSYANPSHEQQAAAVIREMWPEVFLSVSTELIPVIRFYERVSTTVLNATVGPVLRRYLNALTARLTQSGFGGVLLIMQSNGGVARPESVVRAPATTLLSGPAAGPRASAEYARAIGRESCIVVDMGGTSFDASVVRNGQAALNSEGHIDRLRIALPMLDIDTIGAGGGSIGWIDEGGLLRMGPQSAGARPGPACYGRGGSLPTCTDANVVLGLLDPAFFAGGRLTLDARLARDAITDAIAGPLGLTPEHAAVGMYRVINTNMAHGVRRITVRRGLDPREFPLVVAGGAAALHACEIARELDMPLVLVPAVASTLCASGMLLCDLQHDAVESMVGPLDQLPREALRGRIRALMSAGEAQLRDEGATEIAHSCMLDLRYLKQYHEVTLEIDVHAFLDGHDAALLQGFHAAHNRLYGYDLAEDGARLELINLRVRSIGRTEKPELPRITAGGPLPPAGAQKGNRRAFVPETESFQSVPVFDAHQLLAGNLIVGPALLERQDTTVFITASFSGEVDGLGSILLTRGSEDTHAS